MKLALALLFASCCLQAQDIKISVVNPQTPATPLPSPYQFPDTPVGEGNTVVLRMRDAAQAPIELISVVIGNSSGATTANNNFTITGMIVDKTLSTAASSFEDITVSFSPTVQGAITGYLTIVYEVQQNGCTLGGATSGNGCQPLTLDGGALQGNATAPALVLTYGGANGPTQLQPFNSAPFNFGNVSTSATDPVVFTLSNETGASIKTPAVALVTPLFISSAFALDSSNLPAVLPAGSSGTFTITFAPGQIGQTSATLTVGSLNFPLAGTGSIVSNIDALQISYVDSQGVRTLPQTATPISFGQVVAGTSGPAVLTFTVSNPVTSLDPVQIGTLAVSGAAFTATGFPAAPLALAPGSSFTFTLTFTASAKGNYTGALTIGTRGYGLIGASVSPLPAITLQVDQPTLTSQMQAHVSVQLASTIPATVVGQLVMTFTPSVANAADDPAVVFLATNSRQMQLTVAAGTQNASYAGQAALTFQTGTTSGTLTFTVTFPDSAPVTQSFTIAPQKVQIASATAIRQDPYVVVTLTAFDNTYSVSQLSFNFSDSSGRSLTPTPIQVDATSDFARYFFKNDTAGGAFSVQAKFPVTGAVSQIASVSVQVTNSTGTTSISEPLQ